MYGGRLHSYGGKLGLRLGEVEHVRCLDVGGFLENGHQFRKVVELGEAGPGSVPASFGDLSENAEYATAKEEQSKLETRILQLEMQLSKARILDEEKLDTKRVSLGLTVTLKEMTSPSQTYTYTIVGSEEADPKTHSISQKSPVGQAILGKSVGDEVYVKIPKGIRHLKVTKITLADKT
ncbi:MAG: transcription elongation factor GreA [Synergistaceae bacterium]|nr:transcription elongation factor GreA [Synergistaceae bacterium]